MDQQKDFLEKRLLRIVIYYVMFEFLDVFFLLFLFNRHLLFGANAASFLMRLLKHKYIVCKFKIRIDMHHHTTC
jgi:hypothetical protein